MVEVGNLVIEGKMNTSNIEQGMQVVETGFRDISDAGNSLNADFERISTQTSKIVKTFGKMALVGGGAMIAIAKGAPAVAGSMAKMQIAAMELQRGLGRALAPAFEMVSDSFNKFVDWVETKSGTITFFANEVLGDLGSALGGIRDTWNWLSDNIKDIGAKIGINIDLGGHLVDNWGLPAVMGLLAKVFTKGKVGFGGAAIATKVIIEAGETISGKQGIGEGIGSISGTIGGAIGGAKIGALAGSFFGPVGAGIGGFVGGVGGAIGGDAFLSWVGRLVDNKIGNRGRQYDEMQMEYNS